MVEFINCKEINKKTSNKEKILLVGEVQSGKTNKILQIIQQSILADYDMCIFFGGTSNLLNDQSYDRVLKKFENMNLNQKKIKSYKIESIKNINLKSVISSKEVFSILVILKAKNQLSFLEKELFDNINFSNKKVLIIDDEADYASINTRKDNSKIFHLISEIYKNIHSGKLISVTATPYANILQNNTNYLYPDKINTIRTNKNYTGSNFFISNKLYQTIAAEKNEKKSWTKSINDALDFWIISTAKYEYDSKNIKSEFLINIDIETPSHEQIKKIVLEHINNIKKFCPQWIKKNQYYDKILSTENSTQNFKNDLKEIIMKICLQILKNKLIFSLNSKNKQKTNEWKTDKYKYSIIIGGHLLSRGVTFKHLLTELILNLPEEKASADTMLQRARWFGYRLEKNQYKYMKIFMNERTEKSYFEINNLINKFYKICNNPIFFIKKELIDFQKKQKFIKLTGKDIYAKNL